MAEIQAIRTLYNGITFRSKLEAQWAKFFNELCIDWSYETEGYTFSDGTMYLPDFYLTEQDVFFEVKGVMKEFDEHKIKQLVKYAQKPCFVGYPNGEIDLYLPELSDCSFYNYGGFIVYCNSDYKGKIHGFLLYDYNAGYEKLSFYPKDLKEPIQVNQIFYNLSAKFVNNSEFINYWNIESRIEV